MPTTRKALVVATGNRWRLGRTHGDLRGGERGLRLGGGPGQALDTESGLCQNPAADAVL
jgi:hypothetical protein